MCDFLTFECEDPFGVRIHGGEVMKISEAGEVEWATRSKKPFEGSHSSRVMVRSVEPDGRRSPAPGLERDMRTFEFGGNPAKFLNGHNLFGTADVLGLATACLSVVGDALGVPRPHRYRRLERARISRIDLTGSWLVDRPSDVLPFLKAMQENVFCPYRGRGVFASADPGTLYFGFASKGARAKDWQLKIYAKGRELAKRPLPDEAMLIPGLLDEVNRTVRVELTLRTRELKKLGLRHLGDWNPEKAADVWRAYVEKLDFGEAAMTLDDLDELPIRSRLKMAIAAWKSGVDLRGTMSRASWYRLQKEIRQETGYNIAVPCPTSNVVPLRRFIEAKPALHPIWADALTAALRRAA